MLPISTLIICSDHLLKKIVHIQFGEFKNGQEKKGFHSKSKYYVFGLSNNLGTSIMKTLHSINIITNPSEPGKTISSIT